VQGRKARDDADEGGVGFARDRFREQGLAGARRTDQKDALGGFDADVRKKLRLGQRVLDRFLELFDGRLEAAHVLVSVRGALDDFGGEDMRVLARQQDPDAATGDEVFPVHSIRDGDDEVGTGGSLDHDAVVREQVFNKTHDQGRRARLLELCQKAAGLALEGFQFIAVEPRFGLGPTLLLHEEKVGLL
jgi:hypothetical protein